MSVLDTLNNSAWDGTCAEDTKLAPLPPGNYKGVITDYNVKEIGDKCTPALEVQIDVVEGPQQGNRAWKVFWLTDKALPYVARDLKALGHPITKASDVLHLKLEGTAVKFKFGIQKGKDQPEVLWLNPAIEGPSQKVAAGGTQATEDGIPF
jgi:hypothetical protein